LPWTLSLFSSITSSLSQMPLPESYFTLPTPTMDRHGSTCLTIPIGESGSNRQDNLVTGCALNSWSSPLQPIILFNSWRCVIQFHKNWIPKKWETSVSWRFDRLHALWKTSVCTANARILWCRSSLPNELRSCVKQTKPEPANQPIQSAGNLEGIRTEKQTRRNPPSVGRRKSSSLNLK
jgi:hypothetical protein